MSKLQSRRDLVRKLTSAGVAAMAGSGATSAQSAARSPSGTSAPAGDIQVRLKSGTMRFAPEASLQWRPERVSSAEAVVLDPARRYQEILGFGACYMLNQLSKTALERLLRELFHPAKMGFGVCRICLGSSDYATKMYIGRAFPSILFMARFAGRLDGERESVETLKCGH